MQRHVTAMLQWPKQELSTKTKKDSAANIFCSTGLPQQAAGVSTQPCATSQQRICCNMLDRSYEQVTRALCLAGRDVGHNVLPCCTETCRSLCSGVPIECCTQQHTLRPNFIRRELAALMSLRQSLAKLLLSDCSTCASRLLFSTCTTAEHHHCML